MLHTRWPGNVTQFLSRLCLPFHQHTDAEENWLKWRQRSLARDEGAVRGLAASPRGRVLRSGSLAAPSCPPGRHSWSCSFCVPKEPPKRAGRGQTHKLPAVKSTWGAVDWGIRKRSFSCRKSSKAFNGPMLTASPQNSPSFSPSGYNEGREAMYDSAVGQMWVPIPIST